jgi:hypothetical protein
MPIVPHTPLPSLEAQALADLLPLLACGEEAAALTFHRLSTRSDFDEAAAQTLAAIESEEVRHEAYLGALARQLPLPRHAEQTRRAARQFQLFLGVRDPVQHLARIAAIDAGVCTILSRLARPGQPLAADRAVRMTLRRIHRDEARHVAAARSIALRYANRRDLRDGAAAARQSLAGLLALGGDAFETLKVDPGLLMRDVAGLPDGLL